MFGSHLLANECNGSMQQYSFQVFLTKNTVCPVCHTASPAQLSLISGYLHLAFTTHHHRSSMSPLKALYKKPNCSLYPDQGQCLPPCPNHLNPDKADRNLHLYWTFHTMPLTWSATNKVNGNPKQLVL